MHTTLHEGIGLKVERSGFKKPIFEGKHGPDLHRKTGKLNHLERVIDRENDRYFERVTDLTTGEVLHECREPLSEHRGHGSAKQRPDG